MRLYRNKERWKAQVAAVQQLKSVRGETPTKSQSGEIRTQQSSGKQEGSSGKNRSPSPLRSTSPVEVDSDSNSSPSGHLNMTQSSREAMLLDLADAAATPTPSSPPSTHTSASKDPRNKAPQLLHPDAQASHPQRNFQRSGSGELLIPLKSLMLPPMQEAAAGGAGYPPSLFPLQSLVPQSLQSSLRPKVPIEPKRRDQRDSNSAVIIEVEGNEVKFSGDDHKNEPAKELLGKLRAKVESSAQKAAPVPIHPAALLVPHPQQLTSSFPQMAGKPSSPSLPPAMARNVLPPLPPLVPGVPLTPGMLQPMPILPQPMMIDLAQASQQGKGAAPARGDRVPNIAKPHPKPVQPKPTYVPFLLVYLF